MIKHKGRSILDLNYEVFNMNKRNKGYDKLLFGTAGVPISTPKRGSVEGVRYLKELGLDAMELEFVRGVRMKEELAKEVNKARKDEGKELTAHGPYYINLNSKKPDTVKKSRERIVRTARIAHFCGAKSITFHAAYYQKMDKEKVYQKVRDELKKIIQELKEKGIEDVWIRPELTGKPTQFGDIDELIRLSQDVEGVLPCIDFSHKFARERGEFNSKEDFSGLLNQLKDGLGKEILSNMHCHISGIEYGPKGEKNHLNLKDAKLNIKALLQSLKNFDCKGVVICESPNIEGDAKYMKDMFYSLS